VRANLARDGLTVADLRGQFVLQDRGPTIPRWRMERDAIVQLAEDVDRRKPALVVIDNLRKSLSAGISENKTDDINPLINDVIAACAVADAAFLLVHHTNRGNEAYAGAGGIESTIGNVAHIARDWTAGISTITCDSTRDGDEWEPFAVRMGPGPALLLADQIAPDTFDRLLDALKEGPRTAADLSTDLHLSRDTIDRAIKTLQKDNRIVTAGKDERPGTPGVKPWRYALPVNLDVSRIHVGKDP
jgi:AAA domain/HTH domain